MSDVPVDLNVDNPRHHFNEHVYSRKADNKNRYDRYIQGEDKSVIEHSEKKKHNKTLMTKKYANCLHTDKILT